MSKVRRDKHKDLVFGSMIYKLINRAIVPPTKKRRWRLYSKAKLELFRKEFKK